jgi:PAS domain S-box-containing protein/putative nucleotidyltransferase with HDIG domain
MSTDFQPKPAPALTDGVTVAANSLSANERQHLYEMCWVNAPEGVFAIDCVTGEVIDVNPTAEFVSGYSRKELLGSSITMLHPESERERVRNELLKLIEKPSFLSGFQIVRKDGQHLPVKIRPFKSLLLEGRPITICAYFDVADQVEKEHLLATQNWALSAYAGAALALGIADTVEELKQSICEAITHESVYALAWIGIAENDAEKNVRIAAAAGSGIGYMDGLSVSWSEEDPRGRGPTGICIRTGKVNIMEDSERLESFAPWRERARQFNIRSSVAIPFTIEGDKRGALTVYAMYPNAFESAAIEVFEHMAIQIGRGIHAIEQEQLLRAEQMRLEKLQRQLNDALSAMVSPIVTAMEMRDPYTSGHQSRVAEIAVAIGGKMGWPEERLQGLRVAALVHDIGKISTPTEILNKPGRLTAEERKIINQHSEAGYAILRDIPMVWPIAEIVRQHHEKLDGSGYPFGLKGEMILPEARILTVADMVEAMASNRPYRSAINLETVLGMLESQAGILLDAEAVRVCAALFRAKELVMP